MPIVDIVGWLAPQHFKTKLELIFGDSSIQKSTCMFTLINRTIFVLKIDHFAKAIQQKWGIKLANFPARGV